MSTLLVVLIILLVLGGGWGYTAGPWREGPVYWPGGIIGIVVLILLLKVLGVI